MKKEYLKHGLQRNWAKALIQSMAMYAIGLSQISKHFTKYL